jgi:uncharacterized protein YoaH (UPF0181 family)
MTEIEWAFEETIKAAKRNAELYQELVAKGLRDSNLAVFAQEYVQSLERLKSIPNFTECAGQILDTLNSLCRFEQYRAYNDRAFLNGEIKDLEPLAIRGDKFNRTQGTLRKEAQMYAHDRKRALMAQGKSANSANAIIDNELENHPEYCKFWNNMTTGNRKKFLQFPKKSGKSIIPDIGKPR